MQSGSFKRVGADSTSDIKSAVVERTKRCRFCSEEILVSAQKCKHCGEFLSPAARRAASAAPASGNSAFKVPMGEAVVALLFFLPLGIVAIIFASQAQAKYRIGDVDGAEASATTAKTLSAISLIIGVIIIAFVLLGG